MFLRFNRWILVKPLFSFVVEQHKQAYPKFLVLWLISLSPILISAALSPKASNSPTNSYSFTDILSKSFSASEQFVFSTAFLPPIIYLVYERYREAELDSLSAGKLKLSMRRLFDGYWAVLIFAVFTLLITIVTFVSAKTNFLNMQSAYFYDIAVASAPICYGYSLYCWYLSILDAVPKPSHFVETNRNEEDNAADEFAERLSNRGTTQ